MVFVSVDACAAIYVTARFEPSKIPLDCQMTVAFGSGDGSRRLSTLANPKKVYILRTEGNTRAPGNLGFHPIKAG
jgi:hypothetical protein